jgi:hypothetical protein
MIAFDRLRVADGKIVEHWDNLHPGNCAKPGHTRSTARPRSRDIDKTEANKAWLQISSIRR